ncbi:hypothetical protein EU803_11520 [Loktanella sp. IMCC34160]|uniref:DUF6326 family protein n=1 Tax=Loktanella sp. IMCC34160 TaxID=2510646 RepID=UPI00101DB198|nr:DUF6326 family protein [Loktanella sp. IMCC34160]RYG90626.1 hypothetical protein EU803_11520 [Loktanella sp. IMCC34160]
MHPNAQAPHKLPRRELLFTLWVFVMFLYAYCDILGLFDRTVLEQVLTGTVGGVEMTQGFLVAAGVLMMLPIFMVLLTRIMAYTCARWFNIGIGTIKTVVMIATLMTPSTAYYWMFGLIEIATTATIVWLAWTWTPEMER